MNIRVIAPAVGMVGSAEGSQLSLQFLGSHISLLSTITKELHYLKWLQQNACFEGGVLECFRFLLQETKPQDFLTALIH